MFKKKSTLIIAVTLALLMIASCVCVALAYFDVVDIPVISNMFENDNPDKESGADGSAESGTDGGEDSAVAVEEPIDEFQDSDNPALKNFEADYFDIYIGKSQEVIFTVKANTAASSLEIDVKNDEGDSVCEMNDDGENGDKKKGDGIFTGSAELKSDDMKVITYHAAAGECKSNDFEICFYRNITEEEFESFTTLNAKVDSMTFTEAKNHIAASADVESFNVDEENEIITYRTVFGITGVWQDFGDNEYKGSGANAVAESDGVDYDIAKNNLRNMSVIPAVSNTDVAVIRPFRNDGFYYDDFRYAGECLNEGLGGEFEIYDNRNATLDVMKSLDDYGIVLIDSHGTLVDDIPYIIIGEFATRSVITSADYVSSRVCVMSSGRCAVGGTFFNKYIDNDSIDESLWFLGTCYSAYDTSITHVLRNKGADAIYGFDAPVSVTYCNEFLFEIVVNSMLLSGDTAMEGFENAKDFYGDYCTTSHGRCNPVFVGNSEYILTEGRATSDEREICLVLDVSGSMAGNPLSETQKASVNFIETVLGEEGCISVIAYDSSARMITDFSTNEEYLKTQVNSLYSGGGTNIDSGLAMAHNQLKNSNAEKRIIVMMSDGEPTDGRMGDDLINYSDEIKDDGILIYTLGFFESASDKASAQKLMEGIASPGYHYEVKNAEDLVFFFGDIADQINGTRYIHIRIACPVDVKITHNGETLSSAAEDMSIRTEFGSLTFEEIESSDDLVKIVRLKEEYADSYDVKINGTGTGTMDYTISFSDEEGEYTDERMFEDIEITETTIISSKARISDATYLDVDKNGDGKIDVTYKATANSKGSIYDDSFPEWAIWLIVSVVCLIVFGILGVIFVKKYKKYLKTRPLPPQPVFCPKCGTKGIKDKFCNNCGNKL